jgi:hypothetical protein
VKRRGNWKREVNLKIMGEAGAGEKSPRTLRILFPPGADKSAWEGRARILMENG